MSDLIFEDRKGKRYFPHEIIFCDIDTPGTQFLGYVTLESYKRTRCIDDWVVVKIIPGVEVESQKIDIGQKTNVGTVVKGVYYHRQS